MRALLSITKALSDRNRVRAVLALRGRGLCVCQLIELLGLAPSTVSKHLSILRQAGLVEDFKDGRWVYYRLAGKDSSKEARAAVDWVRKTLSGDPGIRRDKRRLAVIVKTDRDALCGRYGRS